MIQNAITQLFFGFSFPHVVTSHGAYQTFFPKIGILGGWTGRRDDTITIWSLLLIGEMGHFYITKLGLRKEAETHELHRVVKTTPYHY